MSKTKKTVTAAPKWGTEAWINAYPWSKMDKDRRRRVKKALGMDDNPLEALLVEAVAEGVRHSVKRLKERGIDVPSDEIEKVKAAVEGFKQFAAKALNTIVAADLARKWNIPYECGGKCTKHAKEGKCSCGGKCMKGK